MVERIRGVHAGRVTNLRNDLENSVAELEQLRTVSIEGDLEIAGLIELVPGAPPALGDDREFTGDESTAQDQPAGSLDRDRLGGPSGVASLPAQHNGSSLAKVFSFAEEHSLEIIGRREEGGPLWIIDPEQLAVGFEEAGFRYLWRGSPATGKKSAWFIPR